MPHYPVLQPDGQWAMFSTIVDAFTMFDATINEALNELENWHRFDRDEQLAHLERIAAGSKPDFSHWDNWINSAAWALYLHNNDPSILAYIEQRTPDMDPIWSLVATYQRDRDEETQL